MEPHTAEIWKSGHTYSNSIVLLNSRTNECFTFTELPRSKFTACPTCSDIFQSSKQSSNPKLIGLFFHVSVKRDPWALASSFETCHCRCDRLYVPALSAGKLDFWISQQEQVGIKIEAACVEEELTYYFDRNNPWIPSHMPTNTS